MAIFKFRARHAKTGKPIKAEVNLGGTHRGYTSEYKDNWLIVETSQSGSYSWYAKYGGSKIDSGSSSGGEIDIIYSPK